MIKKIKKWCGDNDCEIEIQDHNGYFFVDVDYPNHKHDNDGLHGRCAESDTMSHLQSFIWDDICDYGDKVLYDCSKDCVCYE